MRTNQLRHLREAQTPDAGRSSCSRGRGAAARASVCGTVERVGVRAPGDDVVEREFEHLCWSRAERTGGLLVEVLPAVGTRGFGRSLNHRLPARVASERQHAVVLFEQPRHVGRRCPRAAEPGQVVLVAPRATAQPFQTKTGTSCSRSFASSSRGPNRRDADALEAVRDVLREELGSIAEECDARS